MASSWKSVRFIHKACRTNQRKSYMNGTARLRLQSARPGGSFLPHEFRHFSIAGLLHLFIHTVGYSRFSLMRSSAVVKCQSAFVCLALRSFALQRLTVGATRTPAWVLGFAEKHDIRMLNSYLRLTRFSGRFSGLRATLLPGPPPVLLRVPWGIDSPVPNAGAPGCTSPRCN